MSKCHGDKNFGNVFLRIKEFIFCLHDSIELCVTEEWLLGDDYGDCPDIDQWQWLEDGVMNGAHVWRSCKMSHLRVEFLEEDAFWTRNQQGMCYGWSHQSTNIPGM